MTVTGHIPHHHLRYHNDLHHNLWSNIILKYLISTGKEICAIQREVVTQQGRLFRNIIPSKFVHIQFKAIKYNKCFPLFPVGSLRTPDTTSTIEKGARISEVTSATIEIADPSAIIKAI